MRKIIFEENKAKCPECGSIVKINFLGLYPSRCKNCNTELNVTIDDESKKEPKKLIASIKFRRH